MPEFITIVSIIIAIVAVLITLWQTSLTRRTLESQILLTLKQLAREAGYVEGVKLIIALKNYDTYEEYLQTEPKETQEAIYDTVDFLNFVAHLIENKFLPRQTAWNFYFHAYRISNSKLLTWWLEGIRKDKFQGFTGFEKLCKRIGNISDYEIVRHENKKKNSLNKL